MQPLYATVNHAIVESVFWHIDSPAAAIEGLAGVGNEDVQNAYAKLFD